MKERIKKFYKDHKETVDSYAIATAGLAVYTVGLYKLIADRHSITRVQKSNCDEDVLHVRVTKKNGKTSEWDWHPR